MKRILLTASLMVFAAPAFAHVGHGTHGFAGGLMHPLSGIDHLLAAFAVGLWAAISGARRVWLLPLIFVATMTLAVFAGAAGVRLPFVEPAIAVSVLALGLLVAMMVRASTAVAAALVVLFAVVHGHAHGAEGGASAAYLVGLIASTALLHIGGIAFGKLTQNIEAPMLARGAGAAIALAGAWLLVTAGM